MNKDNLTAENVLDNYDKSVSLALEFVKAQTPESCSAILEQTGRVIKYVEIQNPELCFAVAMKQNGNTLQYVENQSPEICVIALKNSILKK
jgi:hypothetical protein